MKFSPSKTIKIQELTIDSSIRNEMEKWDGGKKLEIEFWIHCQKQIKQLLLGHKKKRFLKRQK